MKIWCGKCGRLIRLFSRSWIHCADDSVICPGMVGIAVPGGNMAEIHEAGADEELVDASRLASREFVTVVPPLTIGPFVVLAEELTLEEMEEPDGR